MADITDDIFFRILSNDATVAAWAGVWDYGAGDIVKIYTGETPRDAPFPLVLVDAPVSNQTDLDTFDSLGRSTIRDVILLQEAGDDPETLMNVTEAAFAAFSYPFPVDGAPSGWSAIGIRPVSGPVVAPAEDTLRGMQFPVRVTMVRSS